MLSSFTSIGSPGEHFPTLSSNNGMMLSCSNCHHSAGTQTRSHLAGSDDSSLATAMSIKLSLKIVHKHKQMRMITPLSTLHPEKVQESKCKFVTIPKTLARKSQLK